MQIRRTAAALTSAAALSVTGIAMATPAQAQPVFTGGLVNVTIVDVLDTGDIDIDILNDVKVGAALAIAANVCDTKVNLLAVDLAQDGQTTCTNEDTGDSVTIS